MLCLQFAGQAEVSYCGSSWPGEARWSPEISECVIAYPTRKLYYFIAMVTLFFLPIGVMLTAYSFIIWKLWIHQVPGEFGNARSNGASASGQSSYGGMQYNKNNSVHNRSKKKVRWTGWNCVFSWHFKRNNSFDELIFSSRKKNTIKILGIVYVAGPFGLDRTV